MNEVGDAAKRVQAERKAARDAAVIAIRALENELCAQLGGEPLRGLKNIGRGDDPFYGAQVRAATDGKLRWPDEPGVRETLIVVASGQLMWAQTTIDAEDYLLTDVTLRPVEDDELQAQDLEALLRTLTVVVPRHIASADRAGERYKGLRQLGERVMNLLMGDE